MKTRYDVFIGRWIVFHNGHLEIIKKVNSKNHRPVLILIMDTDEKPPANKRVLYIKKALNKHRIEHKIMIIPPIASVNWGRNVGYETNYIEVNDSFKQISSTTIKQKMNDGDDSWINDVP